MYEWMNDVYIYIYMYVYVYVYTKLISSYLDIFEIQILIYLWSFHAL